MKNINLIFLFLLIAFVGNAQLVSENKDYVLVDSVDLTKGEIYAKTKYFIADNWVSANNVIQLDDKETGLLLLKGNYKTTIYLQAMRMYEYYYYFDYTIEFRMRDGKFKISIKDIDNSKSFSDYSTAGGKKLYLSYNTLDNCVKSATPNKKLIVQEMLELDKFFEGMLNEYKNALISKTDTFDDF